MNETGALEQVAEQYREGRQTGADEGHPSIGVDWRPAPIEGCPWLVLNATGKQKPRGRLVAVENLRFVSQAFHAIMRGRGALGYDRMLWMAG